jgi:Na+/proline symporter
MVTFFLTAAAKFTTQFVDGVSPTTAAVVLALIALAYTLASGLYGVIWTDVFQAFLIGVAAIYVSVAAFNVVPEITPEMWPGAASNTAWPQATLDAPPAESGLPDYGNFLWLALLFFAAKGVLEGLGGSGGSAYMAQRYYAAKSDRETVKLSMLWAVLFTFRWPMVMGFAVLAIHGGIGRENPEDILSGLLLSDLFPAGIRGLAVAALLAASMSTFDSTINAGASYVVKDLWNPLTRRTGGKTEVYVGYAASAAIVVVGLAITLSLLAIGTGVVNIWTGIVVSFFPGFLVPFALRWFWARFNGYGFAAGVAAGFVTSVLIWLNKQTGWFAPNHVQEPLEIAVLLIVSGAGSIAVALLTQPVPGERLRSFYEQIKPWGLWPRGWQTPGDRRQAADDVFRLVMALIWQVKMFMLPMLVVLREWNQLAVVGAIWLATSAYLFVDLKRTPREMAV